MRNLLIGFITCLVCVQNTWGQHFPQTPPRNYTSDSSIVIRRNPWRAGLETVGINMFVWSFNRFIANEDFARINGHTIKDNFKTGPIWDTDKFSTNLLAHPYHGSLYYNAARSNGMNFWQSAPFVLGGSLMWEFFMETEPPSINDLLATTFGGIELGEITYRLSDLFIDNRTVGAERVGREILTGLISPIRSLNRLITGEAWKQSSSKGRTYPSVPVNFIINAGPRFLKEQSGIRHNTTSMNVTLRLDYGDPYDDDFYSPYEWFQLRIGFDFFSSQPLISRVNAIGALWGKRIWSTNQQNLLTGIFQHFDYYDSDLRSNNPDYVAPYRISEAAAVGGGLIYNQKGLENETHKVDIFAEFYLNAVALGASVSDHLKLEERDYNLGSGYSVKGFTGITYNKQWNFSLKTENYHIFTWKGYDPKLDFETVDLERLNVQGERSSSRLTIFSTHLAYYSPKRWNITLSNHHYSRHTRYKYYENVKTSTYDIILSIGYRI